MSKENIGESGCGQRESQTVQLTELEKRDRHPTLLDLFQTLLQCFGWDVPSPKMELIW